MKKKFLILALALLTIASCKGNGDSSSIPTSSVVPSSVVTTTSEESTSEQVSSNTTSEESSEVVSSNVSTDVSSEVSSEIISSEDSVDSSSSLDYSSQVSSEEVSSEIPSSEQVSTPEVVIEYVTITIKYNDGYGDGTYQLEKGGLIEEPYQPTKKGYKFTGWYVDGSEFDFSTPVYEDTVLEAGFEKVYSYKVIDLFGDRFSISSDTYVSTREGILEYDIPPFTRGTIEVDVTSENRSDSGIIFCANFNEQNRSDFWESPGVEYYFFFISLDGTTYLSKIINGEWRTIEALYKVDNYVQGETYTLRVVIDGTTISCFVDGKLYIVYSEARMLTGTGVGLRTGSADVIFSNLNVSNICNYDE